MSQEEKNIEYVDLRSVPNEIIIGVYSAVRGGFWAGVRQLAGGTQLLLDNFKTIINPRCEEILDARKKSILDKANKEISTLGENYSILTREYEEKHKGIIKHANDWIHDLNSALKTHYSFYEELGNTIKAMQNFNEKRPIIVNGVRTKIVVNPGNAVFVAQEDIERKFNILYQEIDHKQIVDDIISEMYSCNEASSVCEESGENE